MDATPDLTPADDVASPEASAPLPSRDTIAATAHSTPPAAYAGAAPRSSTAHSTPPAAYAGAAPRSSDALSTAPRRAAPHPTAPRRAAPRRADGSAGDADYGTIGANYARYRRPDPRIANAILAVLGDADRILNVGAGAGSYEPRGRNVTAVEPSASMRAQRPAELSVAVDATAERLPFADGSFDAAMATFTVHQWPDLAAGLRELRRVTRGPVVILTCDPAELDRFWLVDYAPEVIETESRRYPAPTEIARLLGGTVDVTVLPIPLDCTDGFGEAYYGRPEALLDPGARLANSAWSFVSPAVEPRFDAHLRRDLESGAWDAKYGALRTLPAFQGSLRLIVGLP